MMERKPEREVLVLDGGFGHELKARLGAATGKEAEAEAETSFLAGALACRDHPNVVVDLYRQFLEAGCNVITSNNFVVTPHFLAKAGLGEAALEELTRCAVACCNEARNGFLAASQQAGAKTKRPLIAGSLPPAGATYCAAPAEDARAFYAKLVSIFSSAPIDVLLGETLASAEEALACLGAANESSLPLWVSFTLRDLAPGCEPKLRGGQRLTSAVAALLEADRERRKLAAIIINCCAPATAGHALAALSKQLEGERDADGIALGAYANGFATTTSEWLGDGEGEGDRLLRQSAEDFDSATGVIKANRLCDHVAEWLSDPRVTIVGGCCGIGVDHMQQVSERVKSL